MRCPKCGSENLSCMESRESKSHPGRRRRRHHCTNCGERFSTIEITMEEYDRLAFKYHSAAARFRARVVGTLLAMKNETKGAQRAVVEDVLQRILRLEGY